MYSDIDLMDAIIGSLQGESLVFLPFVRVKDRNWEHDGPINAVIETADGREFQITVKELG